MGGIEEYSNAVVVRVDTDNAALVVGRGSGAVGLKRERVSSRTRSMRSLELEVGLRSKRGKGAVDEGGGGKEVQQSGGAFWGVGVVHVEHESADAAAVTKRKVNEGFLLTRLVGISTPP
jgi:hypothetical protein